MKSLKTYKKALCYILLLICAFLFGKCIGIVQHNFFPKIRTSTTETASNTASSEENWGLSFQEEGKPPVANASYDELLPYDAYYMEQTDKKNLYLTFDVGYENGNTEKILDALKKHNASAIFFVTGHFISENKDLIKRMVEEGHVIGNHTYSHHDMSKISSKEDFQNELKQVEDIYKEIIGKDMPKYYRPPQGKYSKANLTMAKELGYKTIFWSLAYVDWNDNNQPSKDEAFAKLLPRTFPGVIVLLHSTSATNASILDELLTKWEEMGYSFKAIDSLVK